MGIGKKKYLNEELGEGTVELMKTVKRAIDPLGLFNPGKVSISLLPSYFRHLVASSRLSYTPTHLRGRKMLRMLLHNIRIPLKPKGGSQLYYIATSIVF